MSHLLHSKRGHDSDDEEYSHTDVTSDDDLSYYTDDEGAHANESDAEEQQPQEEVETDEAVVISKGKEPATIQEPPTEQVNYQDLDSEEVKEKRIQEHRDYRRKLAEDPSFVPYVGLFWGHDDRYRDDAFTETRAVSENMPHFSNNTNTSIKQYDKSMDPLMYKKWDHSGYEELLRMDEEDERRRKELIAAGELDETQEYRPNRNYQRQHSSRGRGYRQRGGYNNQGQRYQNQGYNNQQNRPRHQNRQEEWPELSKATTTSKNNDQVLVDVSTDETSGVWKQPESTTTQSGSGWEQPKPTTTQDNNGWGQAETTTTQNNNGWGQSESITAQVDTGLGQTQFTATQNDINSWGQGESTTPQTSGGWGQVASTTAQNSNGWGSSTIETETNKEAENSKVETRTENNAGWGTTAETIDNTSKTTDDYHNKRANNSRSIPSEEKASSSWANTDLYTPLPADTQRSRSYMNNRNQDRRSNYQRNDYQQRGDYKQRSDCKQRNDYQQRKNEQKEETSDTFDTSALAETQGWANTSVPMAVDTDAWGTPSKDSTSTNDSWSIPAKESANSQLKETAAVNDSWSSPAKDTTLDYWTTPATDTKNDSWSVPATDSTPKETNDSWSIPAKEASTPQNDSWSIPAKEATTTRSWSTPPQESTTPKDSWSIPAKDTSNSSSAPPQEPTDSWSVPAQEPVVEKTTQANVDAKAWEKAHDSWGTPVKDSTAASWDTPVEQAPAANNDSAKTTESGSEHAKKEEQASWGTSWEAPKKSGWEEAETSTRKSRGYLSQKMDSVPVVENVVVQPQEVEPESSTWSAFRDHDDEDSDVEIILEAEEEHEWLKDEQVLGMTAPFDASKDGKKNSNYHSYESSPRSDVNRKVNGRKPRRNFEENWRTRDDKEEVYRNVPPAAMYYPPQPYVPMIPNANGNPMYAFPMGASTGGSVSPNHDSEGSPHQKYYTSPPMMNPNNMPGRFEANGMVYYGVDPNTMYQPQPYYYYVPMTGANDSSPVMHAENEGWGPSPEREEEWSRSSPSNDKNRNPHSMTYNPSYYYYPPQNPY